MSDPGAKPALSLKHWRTVRDEENTVWLHLDKADTATNVLSREVLAELDAVLSDLETSDASGLVLLSDKEKGFIAGADVHEFTTITDGDTAMDLIQHGQEILDRLAALPFPTVAMLHGYCLGGGMELALACRYRVAADEEQTRLGLPEVRLGIHPGFGGTVRLPRLIGAPAAMDLMLSGRSVSARAARRMGLVDAAVPGRHLRRAAQDFIRRRPRPHKPRWWLAAAEHRWARPLLARYLRRKVGQRAPAEHYPAPYALIDLWQRHAGDPHTQQREEAISDARLLVGETAQNLVHVFFLRERLKGLGKTHESETAFTPAHVHVIGGGIMGGDIAAWCALQGLHVTVQDQRKEALAGAIKRAAALFDKKLKPARRAQAALDRLMPDTKGHGLARADVVIEAIFEDVNAKQELFREIEPRLKEDALLATNTSSIRLESLAEALTRPGRLVGLHFFNPVAKMPLVEVVTAPDTDPASARQAEMFAARIDRLPLPVRSAPGFLVNRVLMPYLLEAVELETEGLEPAAIDRAAVAFGMPMGPLRLADTVGLDICASVADILAQELGVQVPSRLRTLVNAGHLGVKTGRGFYDYNEGRLQKLKRKTDAQVPEEVTDRLILRMLNEAVACLREGIIQDADLVDAGMVFGTGFAPFRGGPMHYAHSRGESEIVETLTRLAERHGERFTPDAGWRELPVNP